MAIVKTLFWLNLYIHDNCYSIGLLELGLKPEDGGEQLISRMEGCYWVTLWLNFDVFVKKFCLKHEIDSQID